MHPCAPGRWVLVTLYGRTFWGVQRTTFVVDPDGKVARVLRNVKPATHDELVLKVLAEAGPPVV